ncbi:hypothetical protein SERLA73DRAFT_77065 [Serpula lacrymans var. lacrymans S7.3]|uniref:Uncharacterized protein n=1 Tax=Serpula lacrymans var. lacrymans (strain S7.3) TaxID=936435 RepID=F8Q8Z9_SERL3|nr:hypothetical protein SERLA73DRAFT_77065 [Serpula lacrymans var. lacrymans S7.3]
MVHHALVDVRLLNLGDLEAAYRQMKNRKSGKNGSSGKVKKGIDDGSEGSDELFGKEEAEDTMPELARELL